jgi:LysR family transcriptional regulator, hydrogen peroxide-inducible genes activator
LQDTARVNLRDLKYFVALADTRHFGKAAQRSFVSQPTLSAQIKKLENYLGVQLIERQPRKVALTETGARVLPLARRMLEQSEEILSLARDQHDPLSGKLKVGLIPTIGPYLLPLITRKLRKQLPKLQLMLYEYQTQPLLEKLRAGEIELAILALPVPPDGLETRELYAESFMLAVPNHSTLAKKASVKLDELSGETLLLLEDGHCLRDQALDVCSRIDVRESDDYRATSLETLRQMVAAGLGITLLPELATRGPFGSGQGLTVKPFVRPVPTRSVGAAWRKSSTRTAAIAAVCDLIAASQNR